MVIVLGGKVGFVLGGTLVIALRGKLGFILGGTLVIVLVGKLGFVLGGTLVILLRGALVFVPWGTLGWAAGRSGVMSVLEDKGRRPRLLVCAPRAASDVPRVLQRGWNQSGRHGSCCMILQERRRQMIFNALVIRFAKLGMSGEQTAVNTPWQCHCNCSLATGAVQARAVHYPRPRPLAWGQQNFVMLCLAICEHLLVRILVQWTYCRLYG